MKFLTKDANSKVALADLKYNHDSKNNSKLCKLLLEEQENFCAYTEKFIAGLDRCDVEHFNASMKFNDNYKNYYAVISAANAYKIKKDKKYKGASFFTSLFFQTPGAFAQKIRFVNNTYEEIDQADTEARNLIDFLGLNETKLFTDRQDAIDRLQFTFTELKYGRNEIIAYFKRHPKELSFITAIEVEFGISYTEIKNYQPPTI